MREETMIIRRRGLLAAPLLMAAGSARAQGGWPSRPIRLIVAYAPGGATDVSARLLAPRLSERLGQNVVVENRTGGGGTVAGAAVAQAAPDGYTLLCDTFSHIVNPLLLRNLAFDYDTAFIGVTRIASFPQTLAVRRNSPFSDLKGLIAAVQANPGSVSAGFAGIGTASHLMLERFRYVSGAALNTVPYRGAGDAARDLAGGNLEVAALAFSTAAQLADAGQARLLAVATAERLPVRPQLPTMLESGLPGMVFSDFAGIFAPAATPAPVRQQIQVAVRETLAEPGIQARLSDMQAALGGDEPDAFATWIRSMRSDMAGLIRDAQIKVE
jgi:tripartite-type tricarboxylate transporter receptor subunit TctC